MYMYIYIYTKAIVRRRSRPSWWQVVVLVVGGSEIVKDVFRYCLQLFYIEKKVIKL